MTATVSSRPTESAASWAIMPGWGICADLTPHEVIATRALHHLRRQLAFALVVVVVVLVGWFVFSELRHSSASSDSQSASDRGAQLTREQAKYSGITRINTVMDSTNGQIKTALAGDSDAAALLTKVRTALPATMTIKSLSVEYNALGAQVATTPGLDVSGKPIIASVSVNGSQRELTDSAAFVEKLSAIRGFVNVYPASTSNADARYSITFDVNSLLLTPRSLAASTAPTGGVK